jgi:hypothetical protein
MTEDRGIKNQRRNFVITGAAVLVIFGGGAFALLHHHESNKPIAHLATTQHTSSTHPATTRAVKHKKKHA